VVLPSLRGSRHWGEEKRRAHSFNWWINHSDHGRCRNKLQHFNRNAKYSAEFVLAEDCQRKLTVYPCPLILSLWLRVTEVYNTVQDLSNTITCDTYYGKVMNAVNCKILMSTSNGKANRWLPGITVRWPNRWRLDSVYHVKWVNARNVVLTKKLKNLWNSNAR
jgi:hypothetical protein